MPDGVPPEIRFRTIWSNPPIRIGKPALHELLRTWLPRLEATGEAVLVVHKHLGSDSLAAWLTQEGWDVQRLSSRMGYRILSVTR
jgi:16S rRNA G1207 methylase RsmC